MVRYNDLTSQEQHAVQEQFYIDVEADARIHVNAYMEKLKPAFFQSIHAVFKKSDFEVKDDEFDVVYIPEIKRYAIDIIDRIAYYKKHESITVDIDNFNCKCEPMYVNLRGNNGMLLDVNDTDVECSFEFAEYDDKLILHDNTIIPEDVFMAFAADDKVVKMTDRIARKWNTVVKHVNDILIDSADMYAERYSDIRDTLVAEKIYGNPEIHEL